MSTDSTVSNKDLHAQDEKNMAKQENKEERTTAVRSFLPNTDIVENKDSLIVTMDMPGVKKENINVSLEKNVLGVEGIIDFSPYKDLKAVYTEYQVGNYNRHFTVSNAIDTDKIEANLAHGVLTLTLPKVPESQPKKIMIN